MKLRGHVRWCVEYLLYDTAGLLREKTGTSVSLLPDGWMPSDVFGKSLTFCFEAQSEAFASCFVVFLPSAASLRGLFKTGKDCKWRIYQNF